MYTWEYTNPALNYSARVRITRAPSNIVVCDRRYYNPYSHQTVTILDKLMDMKLVNEEEHMDGLAGRVVYINKIKNTYIDHLHYFYRYVTNIVGANASFALSATLINKISDTPLEERMSANINRQTWNTYFILNNCK